MIYIIMMYFSCYIKNKIIENLNSTIEDLNNELFCEISYIEQRLENVNYEYFMNDSFDDIYDCMSNFLKNSENSGENSENSSENI